MSQRPIIHRRIARLRGNRSTITLASNIQDKTTTAMGGVCQHCGARVGPLRPTATKPGCSGHQVVIRCPSCQRRITAWVS